MLSNEKYYENIKKLLKPKNGDIHRVLIYKAYGLLDDVQVQYNTMMDCIIENMQREEYEILDVKLSVAGNSASLCFNTMVTYK